MLFWITATVLTFLAVLSILLPLASKRTDLASTLDFDKAIYKARLSEIEKDRTLGRISDVEAKTAVVEEGRKLITLSEIGNQTTKQPISGNLVRKFAVFSALVLLPIGALGLYLTHGNPSLPDQSLASRLSASPEQQSISELVLRAESHLASNPDDARGWSVLAPVYSRLERFEDAARAWANVNRLAPETPEIKGRRHAEYQCFACTGT